jgi:Leucine-rich repeat (LRR) protein
MTSDVGKLVNLRVLKLHHNSKLFDMPDAIGCLQKLEVLDVFYCAISQLPDTVGTLANLTSLRCVPHGTLRLPSDLKVRDCNGCGI